MNRHFRDHVFFTVMTIFAFIQPLSAQSKWEWAVPPQGGDLQKIAYGNGILVALGKRTISVSTDDGVHWSSTIQKQILNMHAIAFGAGVFVVVGDNGFCSSSPDGVHWTQYAMPDTINNWSIAFGNNRFVMLGLEPGIRTTCYTSVDGLTWEITAKFGDYLNQMTFGNGTFLAVANSESHPLYSSIDGKNWAKISNLGSNPQLFFLNDQFFEKWRIEGVSGLMSSSDGKTWKEIKNEYSKNICVSGLYTNGNYCLYPISQSVTVMSENCSTWTTKSTGTFKNPVSIEQSPTTLVALTNYNGIFSSGDGITWTMQAEPVRPKELVSVAYGNGRFVAVDANCKQVAGERSEFLISSVDGKNWVQAVGHLDIDYLNTVTFCNNHFVVTGSKGKIVTSTDGLNWTVIQTPSSGNLSLCAFGDGKYVIPGSDATTFYISKDLTTWSTARFELSGSVDAIIPIGDRFIFCDNDNYSVRFFDSGAPEKRFMPEMLFKTTSIAYGNGKYIGVGYKQIISSIDGINWKIEDSTTTLSFHNLMFCNNQFVAIVTRWSLTVNSGIHSGTDQAIGTSSDGIHWNLFNSGISDLLYTLAYGDNTFVALGTNGAITVSKADTPNQIGFKEPQSLTNIKYSICLKGKSLIIQVPQSLVLKNCTITLLSVSGKKIFSKTMNRLSPVYTLPLPEISKGMYMATISGPWQSNLSSMVMLVE